MLQLSEEMTYDLLPANAPLADDPDALRGLEASAPREVFRHQTVIELDGQGKPSEPQLGTGHIDLPVFNEQYSIALWIKPSSESGLLVHYGGVDAEGTANGLQWHWRRMLQTFLYSLFHEREEGHHAV